MPKPLSHMSYVLRQTMKRIVADPKIPVHKKTALASELDITIDAFNNRIHNRVDLDDEFLRSSFDFMMENCSDYALEFLREYFGCARLSLIDKPRPVVIDINEISNLILRMTEHIGKVSGNHVDFMNDGQLDIFETEEQINVLRKIQQYFAVFEASLLDHAADLVRQGAAPSRRSKSNNGK